MCEKGVAGCGVPWRGVGQSVAVPREMGETFRSEARPSRVDAAIAGRDPVCARRPARRHSSPGARQCGYTARAFQPLSECIMQGLACPLQGTGHAPESAARPL